MTTISMTKKQTRPLTAYAGRVLLRILLYLFLSLCAIVFIFPFYNMFIGSFMKDTDLFSSNPQFWPKNGFNLVTYQRLFTELNFGRPLFNSFYLSAVRTLGVLF